MYTRKAIAFIMVASFAFAAGAAEKHWLGTDATSPTLASVAANWDPAGAPTAGDDVVLDAGSNNNPMTWDLDNGVASWTQSDYTGTVTFMTGTTYGSYTCYGVTQADGSKALEISGNLTLSSGTWTHETTPSTTSDMKSEDLYKKGFGIYRLIVKVGGNCVIGADAEINVDLKGFDNQGPGKCALSTSYCACHGGFGGWNYNRATDESAIYGSVKSPISLGSGNSHRGGGAVRISVSGSLTLDGKILSTISPTIVGSDNYPGSGGSIWITAASLAGSGSVSADGGKAKSSAGCGGAGRVAVYLTGANADFSGFTGTITAKNMNNYGTCGTVYLETAADDGAGRLVIASGSTSGDNAIPGTPNLCTPLKPEDSGDLKFSSVELSNWTNLGIMPGATVEVASVSASQTARNLITLYGGELRLAEDAENFLLANATLRTYSDSSTISVGGGTGTLHLASSAAMSLNSPATLSGSLVVTGTVTHLNPTEASTNRIDLSVTGDMTVATAGAIDVTAKGWKELTGPGAASDVGMGGVHAGTVPGSSQRAYGDPLHPTSHGSGGGKVAGGGAVKLTVGGVFTLSGKIKAYASNNNSGGNGAGGSVWITAAEVAGSGSIDAKGGTYDGSTVYEGAGGSGGRIAVRQTVGNLAISSWGVTRFVTGGASKGGTTSGGGTTYWEKASDGLDHGTLYTGDGNSVAGPQLPPIDAEDAASLATAKLSVGSGGKLHLVDDATVGDFYLPMASTIYLNGHVLTVMNPAKRKSTSVLGTIAGGTIDDIVWPQRGLMFLFR